MYVTQVIFSNDRLHRCDCIQEHMVVFSFDHPLSGLVDRCATFLGCRFSILLEMRST